MFAALIAHHDSQNSHRFFCPLQLIFGSARRIDTYQVWKFDRTESPERIQEPRIDGWAFDELVLFIQYKVVVDDGSEQLSVSILPVPSPENKMSPFDSLRVWQAIEGVIRLAR